MNSKVNAFTIKIATECSMQSKGVFFNRDDFLAEVNKDLGITVDTFICKPINGRDYIRDTPANAYGYLDNLQGGTDAAFSHDKSFSVFLGIVFPHTTPGFSPIQMNTPGYGEKLIGTKCSVFMLDSPLTTSRESSVEQKS